MVWRSLESSVNEKLTYNIKVKKGLMNKNNLINIWEEFIDFV